MLTRFNKKFEKIHETHRKEVSYTSNRFSTRLGIQRTQIHQGAREVLSSSTTAIDLTYFRRQECDPYFCYTRRWIPSESMRWSIVDRQFPQLGNQQIPTFERPDRHQEIAERMKKPKAKDYLHLFRSPNLGIRNVWLGKLRNPLAELMSLSLSLLRLRELAPIRRRFSEIQTVSDSLCE